MGHHTPRTEADELADAVAALDAALREMENWRAHLAAMAAHPEDPTPAGHQAHRSARIVVAQVQRAQWKTGEAARIRAQLTVVS